MPSVYSGDSLKAAIPFNSPFSTYMTYSPIFEQYCDSKKFPFVPFALYLKIEIYYGCQKLSKPKFTRKVPFSTSVTFNQWIDFGDVRVTWPDP